MFRMPRAGRGGRGRPLQQIVLATVVAQLVRMVMRALFRR